MTRGDYYLFNDFRSSSYSKFLYYLLTHSMQHSPSSEANRFWGSQEIPHILWNPKVHYRIHKCPPPVPIDRSIQPITVHSASWRPILILSSHLRLGLPNDLFPSDFPTKHLYTPLLSPIRATCPTHLILLYFITRTILGEQYRSLSSSLCSFLHSPVTSTLVGPNIPLNTLFSNTLSLRYSPQCQRPSFTPTQNKKQNYSSVYLDVYIFVYQTATQNILHRMKFFILNLTYLLTHSLHTAESFLRS